ncbi:hypothetical protein Bca52824_033519 [Brassica carinata]|uniref:MADS-box domain-containing protein n=1 Tax=Brassica carinata TaxID=52824 RepID=A0A8X7SCN8_BRACI|nr:hypothetical protein Bca52824_033519 [Brassica carinata]
MVKGGTKRKAEIKKITNRASRATSFTKRRDGLYSKAAQLCVLSDARIAILATPSSSNSNASFFSFGHSSVVSVVSAYLSGQRLPPVSSSSCDSDTKATREDLGICMARKDLGLGFWWDDDKLLNSKDPEEVMEAMESMEVLMRHLKGLEDQTLTTTVDEDMVEISPDLDEWSEMELNQLLQDCDDAVPVVSDTTDKEEEDQTVSEKTCNNNNNNSVSLLPVAAERSLEEMTMDLVDLDTIITYDDEDLFWSDELLFM